MTVFKPTQQQEQAISIRTGNVFVSAAAGSGKTKAMTERFAAAVIDDKVPVDRILTITFTKEAASQLRDKIKKRLAEAGMVDESRRVPDAYISTIHSLCTRVLKAHPFAAGIDPNFTPLEGVAAKTLVKDAVNLALDEFAKKSEENLLFVYQFGKDRLAGAVTSLYDALRSAGFIEPSNGLPSCAIKQYDLSKIRESVDELKTELAHILTTASRESDRKTYVKNFTVAEALLAYLDIHGYDFLPGLGERFKISLQAKVAEPVFGRAAELIKEIDLMLKENLASRYRDFYAGLLREFSITYRELKAQVSGLDFEDLQLLVKDLFERHPEIRESYKQKFKMIMVDEFQDTNRLQCGIIDLIANNNLFTVGDEFQSIYLFRHADVSVFRGLRERTGEGAGTEVKFPENFRSRKEIIAFVNRVGESEKFFGDKHLGLKQARPLKTFKLSEGPAVEFAVVDNQWQDIAASEAEAEFIARRIGQILAEGVYKPDEVAILIPTRTKLKEIEDALKSHGIYYISDGRGYYGTDEASEIKDLLAMLVNPYDDMSLIGTLRGPYVRLSDDALYLMRKAAGKIDRGDAPLWHAVANKSIDLDGPDREKLDRFIGVLSELRAYASYSSISSVVERAVTQTGYDLFTLMRDDFGASRYANIRKLMRLADAYEDLHGPNLAGFVDYLAANKDLSSDESEAAFADESAGAVRITTIHGSKGLQFPVVFLALSKSKPKSRGGDVLFRSARSDAGASLDDSKAAVAFKVAGMDGPVEAPGYDELKEIIGRDEEEEDKNLLHVAITRAEEYLVISGICDIDKKSTAKTNSYIEWFMSALGLAHEDIRNNRDDGSYSWHDGGVDCKVVCAGSLQAVEAETLVVMADGTAVNASDVSGALSRLPALDLKPIGSIGRGHVGELSYSSIDTYLECPRRFYLQNITGIRPHGYQTSAKAAKIPAATFGSITHEVLENIDIPALVKGGLPAVSESIENALSDYPGLDDSERKRINSIVEEFAASPIAKRLAGAEPIQKETPFSFLLGDTVISGRIDALAQESEHWLVVDYKTGNKDTGLEELAEKYSLQMDLYGLALLKSGAGKVEVAIVALENGAQAISRIYGRQDIANLESRLIALAEEVNRSEQTWPPAGDKNKCKLCGVRRFCS